MRDPDHLHALASRAYGAIFSKNRFFGTTHGDKPTSQNGISLRSPSLIMAPAKKQIFLFVLKSKKTDVLWKLWTDGELLFKKRSLYLFLNDGKMQLG